MDKGKLVKKAKKGDDQAFEQLIQSVREKLYRTAYSYVRNEQDALDLYQDTVCEAYISLKKQKVFQVELCKSLYLNQSILYGKNLNILQQMMSNYLIPFCQQKVLIP